MMLAIKSLHLIAIAIWASGLVCLPGLYRQRKKLRDHAALSRLQGVARFLYVVVISPAAFLAIGSGTALIFIRHVFEPWLFVKLVMVGAMVTVHVITGLVIVRHFEDGGDYPAWRFVAVTILSASIVTAVLFLALAKPDVPALAASAMFEPGALGQQFGDIVNDLNPFQR